jgi:trimethylamine--corrinoid protein Co-methyltransferase
MDGVQLDEESFALETIHEAGPGGDFLTARHTLKHFRNLWQPALVNRQRMDEWVRGGERRLGDRLREKTVSIIEAHTPEPLADTVREELAYILKIGAVRA